MKIVSAWHRIVRKLTPPGSRASLDENEPGKYPEYQQTLDNARLDALSRPEHRIDDWQAPLDDR